MKKFFHEFKEFAMRGSVIDLAVGVINFIIMAFVIFVMVKCLNKLAELHKKPEEPVTPTTKVCPYCRT